MAKILVWLCLLASCELTTVSAFGKTPFPFIVLGDLPYGSPEKSYPLYKALIDQINHLEPSFSVHVGDIKSGSTLCSDEEFAQQKSHFQRFKNAVVYTPGDNEWTDCHRLNNGSYDPVERLRSIRHTFYTPGLSLGQKPIKVQNQSVEQPQFSQYVENLRWVHQKVLFVTLHMVGSNNNLEGRDIAAVTEFFERDAANVAWIHASFDQAIQMQADALVFSFQADVLENKTPWEDFPGFSGFRKSVGETLLPLAYR